jgi:hypothetical protein
MPAQVYERKYRGIKCRGVHDLPALGVLIRKTMGNSKQAAISAIWNLESLRNAISSAMGQLIIATPSKGCDGNTTSLKKFGIAMSLAGKSVQESIGCPLGTSMTMRTRFQIKNSVKPNQRGRLDSFSVALANPRRHSHRKATSKRIPAMIAME